MGESGSKKYSLLTSGVMVMECACVQALCLVGEGCVVRNAI